MLKFSEILQSPESLVPRAGDDALSVGRHGEVEHAVAVPSQLGNLDRKDISLQKNILVVEKIKDRTRHLDQAGIFPDQDLILRVAVGGDQLAGVLRPGQVANLKTSVSMSYHKTKNLTKCLPT